MTTPTTPPAGVSAVTRHFATHIQRRLSEHRQRSSAPLIVGLQGPQGSGKTSTTTALVSLLSSVSVRCAVLSIDDLYHTQAMLWSIAAQYPSNPLLSGRGQPGTHDIELGLSILSRIHEINSHAPPGSGSVLLPSFDKSLHSGLGDRVVFPKPEDVPPHLRVEKGLDVFVLEGWSLGFQPLTEEQVENKWKTTEGLQKYQLQALIQVNTFLKDYVAWYDYVDCFLQIEPQSLGDVYKWRRQQEHQLIHRTGSGMTDAQVEAFVDRYMPGYLIYQDTIRSHPKWQNKSLTVTIDPDRSVVGLQQW